MKKTILFSAFSLMLATFTFTSCEKKQATDAVETSSEDTAAQTGDTMADESSIAETIDSAAAVKTDTVNNAVTPETEKK